MENQYEKITKFDFVKRDYKGSTDRETVEEIKEVFEKGRYFNWTMVDPITGEMPTQGKYCFFYRNRSVVCIEATSKRHKVISYFDNSRKTRKPMRKAVDKAMSFNNHSDKRRMSRMILKEDVRKAILRGIKIPSHNIDPISGYTRFDSRYILDDLCVVLVEKKEEIKIQTIYRISPVNDHDFIPHMQEKISELINGSFYILESSSIEENEEQYMTSLEFNKPKYCLYSSNDSEEWDSLQMEPNQTYSICLTFDSSNMEMEWFLYDLGLIPTEENQIKALLNSGLSYINFDLNKFGHSHVWARPEGRKDLNDKVLRLAKSIMKRKEQKSLDKST